ncbi:MAG: sigma 54-dependent Fis family transcriptional regulator [Deltaproteobacteria bacterium]|nr:sigma 54-dependent Fis family transcriptional regulator [Deltaproteobacteria bacterium]
MTESRSTGAATARVKRGDLAVETSALVRATVTVVDGPDLGLAFPLGKRTITVGKGRDCDVVLTDSAVSKKHVELTLVGNSVRVRDLGSTNGTWIGKTKVIESLVPAGSVVIAGRSRLHLRAEDTSEMLSPSESDHFGELWGMSVSMRQVFAVLERTAGKDVSIFVDGETGTGKELVARAIHSRGGRSRGPFIVLDCSAVAPELVESQLFGHRRGAFTGAMQDRPGVFESARGGTLFLDELDSLPKDLQPKLLRVIETRTVTRLGEFEPRPIDVRLVAASGRSPEEAVSRSELRRDLYFRLAVVRITLPSLRDRLEDLPLLTKKLLEAIGHNSVIPAEGPALDRLRQHPWLGNVRELRNVLERGLLLAPPGATALEQLPLRLSPIMGDEPRTQRGPGSLPPVEFGLPYKEAKEAAVSAFEREYLKAALARNGANLSKTARDVGLTRHHLRKLLRQHRLIANRSK